jgi:hypothetical protein
MAKHRAGETHSASDTPETDAEVFRVARAAVERNALVCDPVPALFSERLERERDEWRKKAMDPHAFMKLP